MCNGIAPPHTLSFTKTKDCFYYSQTMPPISSAPCSASISLNCHLVSLAGPFMDSKLQIRLALPSKCPRASPARSVTNVIRVCGGWVPMSTKCCAMASAVTLSEKVSDSASKSASVVGRETDGLTVIRFFFLRFYTDGQRCCCQCS